MVLGAPRGYYDPYDVPRGPPRGSRSILSIPNTLFNMFANAGLGKCLMINVVVAGLPIEKYQEPTNSPNRLSLKQAQGTASGMREKISLSKEQNPLGESEVAYKTL